ncbi:MAG TPA: NHL repeat-containing protein [Ignavibacteriales bacterium]|nr:NHL repeat-containing protein [Ignavibacteriales bacterium]
MIRLFTAAIILLGLTQAFAQQYEFAGELGHFQGASSFSVNPSGFFYVADALTNEIHKMDLQGNELRYIGGYGWDESSFDDPADVFATTLNVYVSDKNNHRIQVFDRDLNFLAIVRSRGGENKNTSTDSDGNITFGYPTCAAVSTQGDMYILDSENKRILKFNISGEYSLQFGNYRSGQYALNDPKKFAISQDNRIYALDDSSIVIFDQFGTGLARISTEIPMKSINITFNNLVLTSADRVFTADLNDNELQLKEAHLTGFEPGSEISAGLIFKDYLYVLTKKQIAVFKIKKG